MSFPSDTPIDRGFPIAMFNYLTSGYFEVEVKCLVSIRAKLMNLTSVEHPQSRSAGSPWALCRDKPSSSSSSPIAFNSMLSIPSAIPHRVNVWIHVVAQQQLGDLSTALVVTISLCMSSASQLNYGTQPWVLWRPKTLEMRVIEVVFLGLPHEIHQTVADGSAIYSSQ